MIPENIKKLLESPNREDHEIGIILARKMDLKTKEFQYLISNSGLYSVMLDKYIIRTYSGNLRDPYKNFEYKYHLEWLE